MLKLVNSNLDGVDVRAVVAVVAAALGTLAVAANSLVSMDSN